MKRENLIVHLCYEQINLSVRKDYYLCHISCNHHCQNYKRRKIETTLNFSKTENFPLKTELSCHMHMKGKFYQLNFKQEEE